MRCGADECMRRQTAPEFLKREGLLALEERGTSCVSLINNVRNAVVRGSNAASTQLMATATGADTGATPFVRLKASQGGDLVADNGTAVASHREWAQH